MQAAQTIVEVLEVRGSLLARHWALAGCGPASDVRPPPRRGHNRSLPVPVKLCPNDGRLRAAPAQLRV